MKRQDLMEYLRKALEKSAKYFDVDFNSLQYIATWRIDSTFIDIMNEEIRTAPDLIEEEISATEVYDAFSHEDITEIVTMQTSPDLGLSILSRLKLTSKAGKPADSNTLRFFIFKLPKR